MTRQNRYQLRTYPTSRPSDEGAAGAGVFAAEITDSDASGATVVVFYGSDEDTARQAAAAWLRQAEAPPVPALGSILADSTLSFWLKDAATAACRRDALDAWRDADLLERCLRRRLDLVQDMQATRVLWDGTHVLFETAPGSEGETVADRFKPGATWKGPLDKTRRRGA